MGQMAQTARRLATYKTDRVRYRAAQGWRFFFITSYPDGPRVHSASCVMNTGAILGVKIVEITASHFTSSYSRGCEYLDLASTSLVDLYYL